MEFVITASEVFVVGIIGFFYFIGPEDTGLFILSTLKSIIPYITNLIPAIIALVTSTIVDIIPKVIASVWDGYWDLFTKKLGPWFVSNVNDWLRKIFPFIPGGDEEYEGGTGMPIGDWEKPKEGATIKSADGTMTFTVKLNNTAVDTRGQVYRLLLLDNRSRIELGIIPGVYHLYGNWFAVHNF